ncbi:MAG: hypothetical protein JXB40_01770 [Candidatus Omnitrophica bacterium]|nr:hypothetical protein [Candidatus Omnitrophota bacterium]
MEKKTLSLGAVFFSWMIVLSVVLLPVRECMGADPGELYKKFKMGTKPVSVAISNDGMTLETPAALKSIPSTEEDKDKLLKNEALSMAIGYCTFLEITGLAQRLADEGADAECVRDILDGVSINFWIASAWQESKFMFAGQSGFYQIDASPKVIAADAPWDKADHYKFLVNLPGGAEVKTDAALTKCDDVSFIWSSVEKGYFDASSCYGNLRKFVEYTKDDKDEPIQPPQYKPYKDFNLAKWAVMYNNKYSDSPTQYPFTIIGKAAPGEGKLYPGVGLGQVIGYFYNRGMFCFANYYFTSKEGDVFRITQVRLANQNISDAFGPSAKVEDIPMLETRLEYPLKSDNPTIDAVWWGGHYFWQIGWIVTVLNESHDRGDYYAEPISKEDLKDALEKLAGFYAQGRTGKKDDGRYIDEAVQAAIDELDNMTPEAGFMWDEEFNSPETFKNIAHITRKLVEVSTEKPEPK